MKRFTLDQHKKQTGFITPDGYFEAMQQQLLAKTTAPKVIPLPRKTWMYAAAAVVVVALGTVYYTTTTGETTPDAIAIENYLAQQSATQQMLTEALDADDIARLYRDYAADDRVLEELLSETSVEPYLYN